MIFYFKRPYHCLAALILGLVFCVAAWADTLPMERITWDKTPIRLTLKVGAERLIHFPSPVRINVPNERTADLRTQSMDGTVYWLAKSPFETTRILIQEIDSGRTFLFDLSAKNKGGTAPVTVLVPKQGKTGLVATSDPSDNEVKPLDYITLTRFAAQQMYAPSRLLRNNPRIHRVPLNTPDNINLLRGGTVTAKPLISWLGDGGLYITVVRLQNRVDQAQPLDPRDLRGRWLTATFQHARLLPSGNEADTTSVFLISARPFAESL